MIRTGYGTYLSCPLLEPFLREDWDASVRAMSITVHKPPSLRLLATCLLISGNSFANSFLPHQLTDGGCCWPGMMTATLSCLNGLGC